MPMVAQTPPPAAEPQTGALGGDLLQQPTEPAKKKGNKAILFIGIAIFLILVVVGVIIVVSMNGGSGGDNKKFSEIADNLIKKIESAENHPTIYLYDDLKQLDSDFGKSPYGEDIKDTAYIYYLDGKSNVCMSDGKHILKGTDNKYDISDSYKECEFTLTEEIGSEYIENYYIAKGKKVKTGKTKKINGYYAVETEEGTLYAKVMFREGKITVDEGKENDTGMETIEDIIKKITFYSENVLNLGVGSGQKIVDLQKRTNSETGNEYILIQVGFDYNPALDYSEKLAKYLVEQNCPDILIGVHAIIWKDEKFTNAFVIRITIKDGKSKVETVSRDDDNA